MIIAIVGFWWWHLVCWWRCLALRLWQHLMPGSSTSGLSKMAYPRLWLALMANHRGEVVEAEVQIDGAKIPVCRCSQDVWIL